MQYFDVISKTTEWSLFISKANQSISQWSKPMPQRVMLKKMKLNGSMKTYKTFRTNTEKRCPFHYRGLECKSRRLSNTCINMQIWPWNVEWSRARLIEFCQENALVIANTLLQHHKRRLYTWTSPDGQCRNQIDYILCHQRSEALYSQQKQDRELTVAQIINSLLPNSELNGRQ